MLSSFDELRMLEGRLERLESVGQSGLRGFYDGDTRCFALTPGVARVSVTSTVFSLLAIDASPQPWREGGATLVRDCLEALLAADWRENDVFQAVLVVVAMRAIDPEAAVIHENPAFRARLSASIGTVLSSRPMRRTGRVQPLSAYLRFWMAYASARLLNPSGEPF